MRSPDILRWSTLIRWARRCEPWQLNKRQAERLGGEFAPKFAELNDDVLFGQVWSMEDKLSLRDRSIVTVVALLAQGLTDSSFQYHLTTAKNNGVTKTEIAEILTHAAFYAGWPKAWAAFRMAKGYGRRTMPPTQKPSIRMKWSFPLANPMMTLQKYFIGQSYLAPLSTQQVGIYNVTFEPGCRNNWHIHHAKNGGGQILVCVAGHGYYQEWGKPAQELRPRRCGKHSDRGSSTGTVLRRTAGSLIWR